MITKIKKHLKGKREEREIKRNMKTLVGDNLVHHKNYDKKRVDNIMNGLTKMSLTLKQEKEEHDQFERNLNFEELKNNISKLIVDFSDNNYDTHKINELEKKLKDQQSENIRLQKSLDLYKSKNGEEVNQEFTIQWIRKYMDVRNKLSRLNRAIFDNAVDGVCVIDVSDNEYYKFKNKDDYTSSRQLKMPEPIMFDKIYDITYTPESGFDSNGNAVNMEWVVETVDGKELPYTEQTIEFTMKDESTKEELYQIIDFLMEKKNVK